MTLACAIIDYLLICWCVRWRSIIFWEKRGLYSKRERETSGRRPLVEVHRVRVSDALVGPVVAFNDKKPDIYCIQVVADNVYIATSKR